MTEFFKIKRCQERVDDIENGIQTVRNQFPAKLRVKTVYQTVKDFRNVFSPLHASRTENIIDPVVGYLHQLIELFGKLLTKAEIILIVPKVFQLFQPVFHIPGKNVVNREV